MSNFDLLSHRLNVEMYTMYILMFTLMFIIYLMHTLSYHGLLYTICKSVNVHYTHYMYTMYTSYAICTLKHTLSYIIYALRAYTKKSSTNVNYYTKRHLSS